MAGFNWFKKIFNTQEEQEQQFETKTQDSQTLEKSVDSQPDDGEQIVEAVESSEPQLETNADLKLEPTDNSEFAEADSEEVEPQQEQETTEEIYQESDSELKPTSEVNQTPELNNIKAEPQEKKGFFSRLVSGLTKTGQNIGLGIQTLFVGKKISQSLFDELEEQLLIADVGIDTSSKIIENLTEHVKVSQLNDAEALYSQLKEELYNICSPCTQPLIVDTEKHKPFLILMVGVNGVGKTTTIGKITKKLQQEGKSVLLAAADTFRAAAIEQLQEWGERNQVPVIAQKTGADSAAVIYNAMEAAKARNIDVVIADTAGRLQNKSHLLEELRKIDRIVKRIDASAPHEVIITLDAATGQNALSQVAEFDKAIPITGINLTKLDGTAKGGVLFAICDKFQKPIRFIGVGEKIDDLQPFNAKEFVNALFETK